MTRAALSASRSDARQLPKTREAAEVISGRLGGDKAAAYLREVDTDWVGATSDGTPQLKAEAFTDPAWHALGELREYQRWLAGKLAGLLHRDL